MQQLKLNASSPVCAEPDPAPRTPAEPLPPGAVDCHAHVFADPARFPLSPQAAYTPATAEVDAYLAMLDATGLSRGVLVQPSVYGQDNACLLDALRRGGGRLRGVIDPAPADLEPAAMAALTELGVRGVRINMLAAEPPGAAALVALAARLKPAGWHIDIIPDGIDRVAALADTLADLPVPVVIEQMGRIAVGQGLDEPGFAALIRLLEARAVWVKLSHAYHISAAGSPYADTVAYARALAEAGASGLVWGSDWPHPMLDGPMPNDGALLDLLADWVPDREIRRRILVDNPAALYGF